MRDFCILWAERLVSVLVVVLFLAVLVAAVGLMNAPSYMGGGFLMGLAVLIGGGISVIILAGQLYLFFGIHRNTQRTNALLEDVPRR